MARADIVEAIETWAADFKVRDVHIDRSTYPTLVEVTVVGTLRSHLSPKQACRPGGGLSSGVEVRLEVTWAPMTAVEAPAP